MEYDEWDRALNGGVITKPRKPTGATASFATQPSGATASYTQDIAQPAGHPRRPSGAAAGALDRAVALTPLRHWMGNGGQGTVPLSAAPAVQPPNVQTGIDAEDAAQGIAMRAPASQPIAAPAPVASPVAPSYAVGGSSMATPMAGQAAQQAIANFNANPTDGSGYMTMGGRTTMVNPRQAANGAPSGVTPQDFQAATARAAQDRTAVAQLESRQNLEALRNYTPPPLNLSGGIRELAESVQARRQGRKMQTQAIDQAGRQQDIAQRGEIEEQQIGRREEYGRPLRDAQTRLTEQNIAKGAQEAQQRVQVIQLRQQILAEKDPAKRKVLENQLYAIQGKQQPKYQIVTQKGVDQQNNQIETPYIIDEEGNARPAIPPQTQRVAPVKGERSVVNGKTAIYDGTKWVPQ
jgi:hypothetical protein